MKRAKTPTFLLELPLRVDWSQEHQLRAHLDAARCLYNALLGEANARLRRMRHDPEWDKARAIPRSKKQERAQAFSVLRKKYHFSEYDLHEYAKQARVCWIADHIESTMTQTLATRAYQAANRVCVGEAKRVRFRSSGRGLDSVEGKRNDVEMRFVLDPNAGDGGFLIWNKEVIPAIIDWRDPVVQHGMRHKIKYVRLVRRKASSQKARGANCESHRYYVQLVLEGHAFIKPKHEQPVAQTIGLDIGPSTLAIVAREGKSAFKTKLSQYCHQCGHYVKKARSQRWHHCACGLGPVQRDLYSAFLLAYLEPEQTIPSVTHHVWEGAEPRLRAVMEGLQQRANEGHPLPRSMGLLASGKAARAKARRLQNPAYPHQ